MKDNGNVRDSEAYLMQPLNCPKSYGEQNDLLMFNIRQSQGLLIPNSPMPSDELEDPQSFSYRPETIGTPNKHLKKPTRSYKTPLFKQAAKDTKQIHMAKDIMSPENDSERNLQQVVDSQGQQRQSY